MPPRQAKSVPRSEVIWLLIHVHNVRLEFRQQAPQPRIEMKMKTAVEEERLDDERVPVRMRALQAQHTALVAPRGRDGQREFNAGTGGYLFQLALISADDAGFGNHQDTHGCGVY